jgi:succinate-semialdehyde dehydrogenase/glutarate-semialdehyde dehydrogenase
MIATDSKVATVSFYIDGAWETPRGRAMGAVTNPATGAVLAEVPYANASDVDTAVRAAHAGQASRPVHPSEARTWTERDVAVTAASR